MTRAGRARTDELDADKNLTKQKSCETKIEQLHFNSVAFFNLTLTKLETYAYALGENSAVLKILILPGFDKSEIISIIVSG